MLKSPPRKAACLAANSPTQLQCLIPHGTDVQPKFLERIIKSKLTLTCLASGLNERHLESVGLPDLLCNELIYDCKLYMCIE